MASSSVYVTFDGEGISCHLAPWWHPVVVQKSMITMGTCEEVYLVVKLKRGSEARVLKKLGPIILVCDIQATLSRSHVMLMLE